MSEVRVKPGQTLTDIAVQYLGDQSAVMELARVNEISVTGTIQAGQVLILPEVIDQRVAKVMAEGSYEPAAGVQDDDEGIGFWAIGEDFEVQ